MRPSVLTVLFALPVAAGATAAGCGTDAVGVEPCRQIEEARCLHGPNCNVDMSKPVHRDAPTTDIDACTRFYRDACLHGLSTPNDPGAVAVKACVDAINTGDCNVVLHPETHPSCAFLVPPPPPPPPDAAAADAAAD